MEEASAYVEFEFPPPLFRTYRCKVLPRNDGGVEESFHWVVEDQIYLALTRDEGLEDRGVREEPNGRSDDELSCRKEWWKCDDRSEMRRLEVEGDLLKSLSILRIHGTSVDKSPHRNWNAQQLLLAIHQSHRTSLPVRRSGPDASGGSSTGS